VAEYFTLKAPNILTFEKVIFVPAGSVPVKPFVGQTAAIPVGVDGLHYNYAQNTHHLTSSVNRPTANETREFKNGLFQVGLVNHSGITFLLVRFGQQNWMDAPFCYAKNIPDHRTYPTSADEPFWASLVDTSLFPPRVVAVRQFTLNTQFVQALRRCIDAEQAEPKSAAQHDATVDVLYRLYTTRELLNLATYKDALKDAPAVPEPPSEFAHRALRVVVPYPSTTAMPRDFTTASWSKYEDACSIDLDAADVGDEYGSDPIAFGEKHGAWEIIEITIDGKPSKIRTVKPSHYSEEYGLDITREFGDADDCGS